MGRTLRKGLPRFVVFIMCDEVAGETSAGGMVGYGQRAERQRKKGRIDGQRRGETRRRMVAGGGVGEAGLVRAFFAFLLRNLSSPSEDVTSESLAPWSTLMDVESRLLREPAPKEGARFSGRLVPANESERMIR